MCYELSVYFEIMDHNICVCVWENEGERGSKPDGPLTGFGVNIMYLSNKESLTTASL